MSYEKDYKKNGKRSYHKASETVQEVNNFPIVEWESRGLNKETMAFFGVRCKLKPDGGDGWEDTEPISAVYFPYYNKDLSRVIGYKKRDLTKDKEEDGHFSVVGHLKDSSPLFGQNVARKSAKFLTICEGEVDTLSAFQAIQDANAGTKFEALTPACVGIPLGTKNAKTCIAYNEKFIGSYSKPHKEALKERFIVLAFDNDEANKEERKKGIIKGIEATEECARYLANLNLHTLLLPAYINDLNDMIMQGKSDRLAKLLRFETRKYESTKIVTASSYSIEDLIKPVEHGVYYPSFPILSRMLIGQRKSEITVITSLSGAGKTAVAVRMAYESAIEGNHVTMIMLEERVEETIKKLMACYCAVHPRRFMFDPTGTANIEVLEAAKDWIGKHFSFIDHQENIEIEELLSLMRTAKNRYDTDYFIFDHITLAVTGKGSSDERADLEMAMGSLRTYIKNEDIGLTLISHVNRKASDELRGLSNMTKPVWIRVKKEDLKGSSALEQLSWNIIGIDLLMLPNRTRGAIGLSLLKNRVAGTIGICDCVVMDEVTGVFVNAEDWAWDKDNETFGPEGYDGGEGYE